MLYFLDLQTEEERFVIPSPRGDITTAAFSWNGEQLATGGTDGVVRVWDVTNGGLLNIHPNQLANIMKLSFTEAGDLLAFGDPNEAALVWDAVTLEPLVQFSINHEWFSITPQRIVSQSLIYCN